MTKKLINYTIIIAILILLAGNFIPFYNYIDEVKADKKEITIGYFPNVTHAPAIVGIKEKSYQITRQEISRMTKQKLALNIIKRSFARTNFTASIDKEVLQELADLSFELGFITDNKNLDEFIQSNYLEDIVNENS